MIPAHLFRAARNPATAETFHKGVTRIITDIINIGIGIGIAIFNLVTSFI